MSKTQSAKTCVEVTCHGRWGLSTLEVIGSLIALLCGIWLGAVYLGVDIRHEAQVALAESELIEKIPDEWRPAGQTKATQPTAAEVAEKAQLELAALRHEITSLRTSSLTESAPAIQPATNTPPATATVSTESLAKAATLEYWSQLNTVLADQSSMQREAEQAATAGNAIRLAEVKSRIRRFAASAIKNLSTTNVDPIALAFGKELANWHAQGADLYDEAARIWETSAATNIGTPATRSWEQAQLQHQNESQLLESRSAGVRDGLTRRFGEGFAPFVGL